MDALVCDIPRNILLVLIFAIDYHISISKKPKQGSPPSPIQELSFSTYGPNNKDNHLQSLYRRTADNTYIQALPNGEVIAFRTKNSSATDEQKDDSLGAAWGRPFPNTIVAIFDVLKAAPSSAPFVLLQPQPTLSDLFPQSVFPPPHAGSAYIGLVEETGSLFALSPSRFPLVVFGSKDRHGLPSRARQGQTIGSSSGTDDSDQEFQNCLRNPHTPRCLVGVHKLMDGEADAEVGRWKRLIDPPKADGPAMQQPMDNGMLSHEMEEERRQQGVLVGWPDEADNASGRAGIEGGAEKGKVTRPVPVYDPPRLWHGLPLIGDGRGSRGGTLQGSWEVLSVWVVVALVGIWVVLGRLRAWFGANGRRRVGEREHKRNASVTTDAAATGQKEEHAAQAVKFADEVDVGAPPINNAIVDDGGMSIPLVVDPPAPSTADILELARPSTPKAKPAALKAIGLDGATNEQGPIRSPLATPKAVVNGRDRPAVDIEEGDESEGEGDGEAPIVPGKRKSRRGKRGKKKKATVAQVDGGEKDEQEKEQVKDKAKEEERPSSIVLTTSSPKPVAQHSLIVSDNVLGASCFELFVDL